MDVKVSIIVPVYNVERYLPRCLDSLVNQTLDSIEIILINDASPDHSDKIMEEYRQRFPELIKCIYLKENLRQGGARNSGLKAASGEYICFVDSDDWISPDYAEKLYDQAVSTESDIVYCGYKLVTEKGERICSDFFPQQCGIQDALRRKAGLLLTATGPCWCMIKRDLLLQNELFFPEKMLYEDMAICPIFLYYAGRMSYAENTYYYYYQREDSTVHEVDSAFQVDEAKAILYLLEQMKTRGIAERYPTETEAMFTKYFYAWGMHACYDEKFSKLPLEYMQYLARKMHELYPNYRKNPYYYGNIEPSFITYMHENDARWLDGCQAPASPVDYMPFYRQESVREKISELIRYLSGQTIGVWGAGKKGKEFLRSFDSRPIEYVIDMKPSLADTVLDTGQVINSPEPLIDRLDVVLIPNKNHYRSIRETVRTMKAEVKIVNLDLYLLFDFSIEACVEEIS